MAGCGAIGGHSCPLCEAALRRLVRLAYDGALAAAVFARLWLAWRASGLRVASSIAGRRPGAARRTRLPGRGPGGQRQLGSPIWLRFSVTSFCHNAAVFWSLGWLAAGIDGWRRVVTGPARRSRDCFGAPQLEPPMCHPISNWREQVAALRAGRSPIFADARTLGSRCFTPARSSGNALGTCNRTDHQIHAFAICVPLSVL